MSDLPEHILIVVCKHSKGDESILKILKEYFSDMPHIIYTHPSLNIKDTYYILPYTNTFRAILCSISEELHCDLACILGFVVYDQMLNYSNTYGKNFDREVYNSRYMPLFIKLNHNDIQKLESFTEV